MEDSHQASTTADCTKQFPNLRSPKPNVALATVQLEKQLPNLKRHGCHDNINPQNCSVSNQMIEEGLGDLTPRGGRSSNQEVGCNGE